MTITVDSTMRAELSLLLIVTLIAACSPATQPAGPTSLPSQAPTVGITSAPQLPTATKPLEPTKALDATKSPEATKAPAPSSTTAPQSTKAFEPTTAPQATKASEPTKAAAQQVLRGDFYALGYKGGGRASLTRGAAAATLSFSAFTVESGPALNVYLVAGDPVGKSGAAVVAGGLKLGKLKALSGDQSYTVPADTDLTRFKSVVVWCDEFGVGFVAAPLR